MSFHHSPRIITNGLVFHVDAADPKCYTGGSVCKDLTNINGNGTITNVSLSSDKAFLMNGTTSSISFLKKINLGVNFTYSVAFYIDIIPAEITSILSSFNNNFGGMGISIYYSAPIVGLWDVFADNYATGDELIVPLGTGFTIDKKINVLTGTFNGSSIVFYYNGARLYNSDYSFSFTEPAYIDLGFANGNFWNGLTTSSQGLKIYRASVYNRALNDQEIFQNYNAMKGRYRL